jgi:hypothetical protein
MPIRGLRHTNALLLSLSYLELCETAPAMTALIFLQTQLNAVVAHEDPEECALCLLFPCRSRLGHADRL